MKKSIGFIVVLLTFGMGVNAFAANGQGIGLGRTDTVNINDYSTNNALLSVCLIRRCFLNRTRGSKYVSFPSASVSVP